MRGGLLVFGAVLIVLGGLWTLQGIGIVGGSSMTGQSLWATIGGLFLTAGLLIGAYAARRRPLPPR